MTDPAQIATQKAAARRTYLARRAARSRPQRRRAELALLDQARRCDAEVLAAFVPIAGEPGSLAVLDELNRRATVLLPIIRAVGEPMEWAAYAGGNSLVSGPFGVRQPARTDGSSLWDAELVLVPALAIGLDGTRLGHGAGFYDRTLLGLPSERLCAVVHDDEVADTLPVDAHDVRVGWVRTPRGTRRLI